MSAFHRIAVLGANGQVGSALMAVLGDRGVALTRAQADLAQPESLAAVLDAIRPDAVINAAAYTAVDKAEEEPDAAFTANADSPAALARWCAAHDVPFVHYSTDYVFDGSGSTPWPEDAHPHPQNTYGASKLAGEKAVIADGGKFLIFRTSWVYDAMGKNFFNTMLRLGAERQTLNVVADQVGAPSYAPHLADYTLRALELAAGMMPFPSGVYHLVNAGETSWHGFASAIFEGARAQGLETAIKTVEPIETSAYPTPAKRPLNSRLDCSRLRMVFGLELPRWEEGLAHALEQKKHASHHLSA